MKKKHIFYVQPMARPISASHNQTILESLLSAAIEIDHSCGGNGTCGTCRVRVENIELMPGPNEIEAELRTEIPFDSNERLACQNFSFEGLRLHLREKKVK
ncbi:MAG: 2Fe-2S iron-sulfur cluster-binding protein [Bdellovibrionota bacterium]